MAAVNESCGYCGGSGRVASERNFLLERHLYGDHTWVGRSSTAMVTHIMSGAVGLLPDPHDWPSDRWDLGRCEETLRRAPDHMKPAMAIMVERFRRHISEGGLYCRGCDNSIGHSYTRDNLCAKCDEACHVA